MKLGKENLIDIVPVCYKCYSSPEFEQNNLSYILRKVRHKGNKKIERLQLSPLSFSPLRLSEKEKLDFVRLASCQRGRMLSSYFAAKTKPYGGASSIWINSQVHHACRWIKNQSKEKLDNQFDLL
jgi:hypothetical protein